MTDSTTPGPEGQQDAHVQVLTAEAATRTSDLVAQRIKILRQTERLATECADTGAPEITRSIIANTERGRRAASGRRTRDVTVDELLAIAIVLRTDVGALLGIGHPIGAIGAIVVRQLRSLADAIEETGQP
jgi:hypothetical protein